MSRFARAARPCDDGGLRRCGPASDPYWEIHARIALPQFQAGTPPFEAPEDGGAIVNDLNPRAARGNLLRRRIRRAPSNGPRATCPPAASSPTGFDVSYDATRFVLVAHSQGATHAQLVMPYEPSLAAVVRPGAGGDLTESLLTKTEPVNVSAALPLARLDPDRDGGLTAGDYHPALALIQTFFERADPVRFGGLLHREPIPGSSRHLLMTYGLGDSGSTERTMRAHARSDATATRRERRRREARAGLGGAENRPRSRRRGRWRRRSSTYVRPNGAGAPWKERG